MSSMKKCGHCRNAIPEDVKVCAICGAKQLPSLTESIGGLIGLGVVLFVLFIIWVIFF
jgi:RNA polymerase subunit RPABC4/transcription elongation factor Spt4